MTAAVLLPINATQAEIAAAPSLAAAVIDLDSRRARSRQRMIGASELGECKRRAAYRIARTKPTNVSTGLAAFLGTEIHKGVLRALRRMYGGYTEVKLQGEQIKGSCDWYDPPVVEDLKTVSKGAMERVLTRGTPTKHKFQVVTYAWLLRSGLTRDRRFHAGDPNPVEALRIRYLSRDNGEDWVDEFDYDPFLAAEAIHWLSEVYADLEENGNDPEAVDRQGFGPGIDSMCDWCPFLDACWGPPIEAEVDESRQSRLTVTDEDFIQAVADYDEWRTAENEAKRQKEYARERLRGRSGPAGELHCAWSGGNETNGVDKDEAVERLIAMGEVVPTKTGVSPRQIRVTKNVQKSTVKASGG